jgi:hypothetical protein
MLSPAGVKKMLTQEEKEKNQKAYGKKPFMLSMIEKGWKK